MCLILIENKKYITDEDITTYKVGYLQEDGTFVSPIRNYKYTLGILNILSYPLQAKKANGWYYYIKGFYSFESLINAKEFACIWRCNTLAECTVPKDSEYYMSEGEIVSNKLVINKIVSNELLCV